MVEDVAGTDDVVLDGAEVDVDFESVEAEEAVVIVVDCVTDVTMGDAPAVILGCDVVVR